MANNDEFYANAAQKRLNQLDAERLRAQHDLAVSLSQNDQDSAAIEIDTIAEIDAKRGNLIQLAQREIARNQPSPPQYESQNEWKAKDATHMNWKDAVRVFNEGAQNKITEQEYIEGYNRALQGGWAPGRGSNS
jgi:hypothetical protein